MQNITVSTAQKLSSPNPFCLVTSKGADSITNIMALSWWTYVSNQPASLVICIGQKSYSNQLIKESREFNLCLADDSIAEAALKCGSCSGRDVNKAEAFGIELTPACRVGASMVKKSKVVYECKVSDIVSLKDHDLFIAEVLEIHANPEMKHLYAYNGYSQLKSID